MNAEEAGRSLGLRGQLGSAGVRDRNKHAQGGDDDLEPKAESGLIWVNDHGRHGRSVG
jgi:hypothetical protein